MGTTTDLESCPQFMTWIRSEVDSFVSFVVKFFVSAFRVWVKTHNVGIRGKRHSIFGGERMSNPKRTPINH
jgi:hypothetical protein